MNWIDFSTVYIRNVAHNSLGAAYLVVGGAVRGMHFGIISR